MIVTGSSAKKSVAGDFAGAAFAGGGIPVIPAMFDWLEVGGVRLTVDTGGGGGGGGAAAAAAAAGLEYMLLLLGGGWAGCP